MSNFATLLREVVGTEPFHGAPENAVRLSFLAKELEKITPEMAREVHQDWCAAAYSTEKECGCGRAVVSEILATLAGKDLVPNDADTADIVLLCRIAAHAEIGPSLREVFGTDTPDRLRALADAIARITPQMIYLARTAAKQYEDITAVPARREIGPSMVKAARAMAELLALLSPEAARTAALVEPDI